MQTNKINDMTNKLKEGDTVDIKEILNTKKDPINADNMMSSPGLWEYSRPLTLPRVQNRQQAEVYTHSLTTYSLSTLSCPTTTQLSILLTQ